MSYCLLFKYTMFFSSSSSSSSGSSGSGSGSIIIHHNVQRNIKKRAKHISDVCQLNYLLDNDN